MSKRKSSSKHGKGSSKKKSKTSYKSAYQTTRSAIAKMGMGAALRNTRTEGVVGLELKYYDTALLGKITAPRSQMFELDGQTGASTALTFFEQDGSALDAMVQVNALNCPRQGAGARQRIGRQITCKSLVVDVVVDVTPTGILSADWVNLAPGNTNFPSGQAPANREIIVALVLDRQNNASLAGPTISQVFEPAPVELLGIAPWKNKENSRRFQIVDIKRVYTDNSVSFGNLQDIGGSLKAALVMHGKCQRFQLNWKGSLETNFQTSTPNAADITDNAFRVFAFASVPRNEQGVTNGVYPNVTITASARLNFYG